MHGKVDSKTRRIVNETWKKRKGAEMRMQISQLESKPGGRDVFFRDIATSKVPVSLQRTPSSCSFKQL